MITAIAGPPLAELIRDGACHGQEDDYSQP
jgi:hypothetical protein